MKEAIFGFFLGAGVSILFGYNLSTWQFWVFVIPILFLHYWCVDDAGKRHTHKAWKGVTGDD